MATYTAKCPTCNEEVSSTFSQAQANRNLGLHRRKAHGYQSPEYEEARQYRLSVKRKLQAGGAAVAELEAKARAMKITPQRREQLRLAREARWGRHPLSSAPAAVEKRKVTPSSTGNIDQRREYQRLWRENRNKLIAKAKAKAQPSMPAPDAALPCNLPRCPVCGSAFYVVKGQQQG